MEAETVDWLMKFDPDRACVMHRHTGPTKTFVLEGEHHVFEPIGAGQFRHVARKAGTWATSEGDNVHYESGGTAGGVIYLCMKGRGGIVYDMLNDALQSERTMRVFGHVVWSIPFPAMSSYVTRGRRAVPPHSRRQVYSTSGC